MKISSILPQDLPQAFQPETLNALARETGFLQRQNKLSPQRLFWILLEFASVSSTGSLSDVHRFFCAQERAFAYSSLHDAFSREAFPRWLKEIALKAYVECALEPLQHLPEAWNHFEDIVLHDASILKLHPQLAHAFPAGFRNMPAALTLHASYSLKNRQFLHVEMTAQSAGEQNHMPSPDTHPVSNRLFIFDRGYIHLDHLHALAQAQGTYLVRLKSNHNPIIEAVYAGFAGRAKPVKKYLKEVRLKAGKAYDLAVKLRPKSGKAFRGRMVILWNPVKHEHTYFLTNLPVSTYAGQQIGGFYRFRWQIELSFKELKSYSGLQTLQSQQASIVEGFAWVAWLAYLVRRYWLHRLEVQRRRYSPLKAARSSGCWLPAIFEALRVRPERLKEALKQAQAFLNIHARPTRQDSKLHQAYLQAFNR